MRWKPTLKKRFTTPSSPYNKRSGEPTIIAIVAFYFYLSTGALDKAAEVVSNFELARKKYAGKYRLDFLLFTLCQCGWYYFLKKTTTVPDKYGEK